MSQYDFGTINPATTSGSALATLLGSWRDAQNSNHSGSSRPSYVVAGMTWLDTTADPAVWKYYDGAGDIVVGYFHAASDLFMLSDEARIVDAADTTKRGRFRSSRITGGQTRNIYLPDKDFYLGGTVVQAKSSGYTAVQADIGTLLRFTASATLALTAAATLGSAWSVDVLADGADVTIDPNSSETINGAATLVIRNGHWARIYCDGTGFYTSNRPRGVIQVSHTAPTGGITGTTTMPEDDTIPQNTEGHEYMTLAITPTSAGNKLMIDVVFHYYNASDVVVCAALFQDSTADALTAAANYPNGGSARSTITLRYYMTAGTTSETTFKVRAGGASASSTIMNSNASGRIFGAIPKSSITITEIAA